MKKSKINTTEHEILWGVIDRIAKDHKMSVSALAVAAGLDPTAFNKSKRIEDGIYRMPNVNTILAVMRVIGINWFDWADAWYNIEQNKKAQK